MFERMSRRALTLVLCWLFASGVYAETPPYQEPKFKEERGFNYKDANNVQTDVKTLTTDLFGDQIDPGTGSLQFSQTDVSIPGNFNLPVAITRTLSAPDSWFREAQQLGNWSLDIPHARSTFVSKVGDFKTAYWPNGKACSSPLNANPGFQKTMWEDWEQFATKYSIHPDDYWNGDTIYLPGLGSTKLLTDKAKYGDYRRLNNKQWHVACGTKPNGQEYFVVTTPDGTKYHLSEQRIVEDIEPAVMMNPELTALPCIIASPNPDCNPDKLTKSEFSSALELQKNHIFLLASRVEDKFGNFVEYTYSGNNAQLDSIKASDGREIELSYNANGLLSKVTANDRKWLYGYGTQAGNVRELQTVTLPDEKTWTYQYDNPFNEGEFWHELFPPQSRLLDNCSPGLGETQFVTITHPYGLQGTFYIDGHCQGQTNVPKLLEKRPEGLPDRHYIKKENRLIVLSRKTLKLSDSQSYEWQYDYSTNKGLFDNETVYDAHRVPFSGETSVGREHLNTTKITQPDKSYQIHYFDRRYGKQQGNALFIEYYDASGLLLKRTANTYDYSTTYGQDPTWMSVGVVAHEFTPPKKAYNTEQLTRLKSQIVTLFEVDKGTTPTSEPQFSTYTKQILDFNDRNQPITVHGFNDIEPTKKQRYIRYGYLDDTAHGVYGLPTTLQVSATAFNDSEETGMDYTTGLFSETTYKPLSETKPVLVENEDKRFGVWQSRVAAYHPDGNPKKVEYHRNLSFAEADPAGSHRYIQYDNYFRGLPKTITVPGRYGGDRQTAHRQIDKNGWVDYFIDFSDNRTDYSYDSMGRIASVKSGEIKWLDTLFSWSFPTTGPVRTVTRCELVDGQCQQNTTKLKTTTQYDTMLRPIQVTSTDVKNQITQYQTNTYNSANQPTFQSLPTGDLNVISGTHTTYDGMGREIKRKIDYGGITKTEYLAGNRIKVSTQQSEHIWADTTTTYLAYGSPSYDQATLIKSPEDVTTALDINLWGNITAITQSGMHGEKAISHTEDRSYSSQQRLIKTERGDVGITSFGYNDAGEVIWQAYGTTTRTEDYCTGSSDATNVICFDYDNLGDKHKVTFTDGTPQHTYTYDKLGNLTGLDSGFTNRTYQYNSQSLLEEETLKLSELSLTLGYEYDAMGHLSAHIYPDPEVGKVTYTTNAFGQFTGVKRAFDEYVYAKEATYHTTGNLNTFTYGNGIKHTTKVDRLGRPTQLHDANSERDLHNLNYSYDHQSNITSIIDKVDDGYSLFSLTYDKLDRLAGSTGGTKAGNSSMGYDALGNIIKYHAKGLPLDYTYDLARNQLLSVASATDPNFYNFADGYDERGNVIKRLKDGTVDTFTYNLANQMVEANENVYIYDGHNRRVKATRPLKGDSYAFYTLEGRLLYRQTPDGNTSYIFLGDKLIAKDSSEYQGSQNALHYKPFGDTFGPASDDIGYTGHKFDTDLHLSYMQARWYDPIIGRFYSNDPIDIASHLGNEEGIKGFNRYSYVVNSPFKYTDPDGKAICGGACIGAAVGLGVKACTKSAACRKTVASGAKSAAKGAKRTYNAIIGIFNETSSETDQQSNSDDEKSDEEKSEEEILKEKRARRQETIDDYVEGYLPDVHDNHGMERENNRKEDDSRDEDN